MSLFVLDTSALFALIEAEPGGDRLEEVLTTETAILSWLALMEVYYVTLQERGPWIGSLVDDPIPSAIRI
ncbi:MAG: PIN domain-containing protein [Candidatus Eremiobacterota bacterium]